jgi:LytS/YehU family sensor histidine kinase
MSATVADIITGLIRISVAVAIGFGLRRVPRHVPWPFRPLRWRYVFVHVAIATSCVLVWYVIASAIGHSTLGEPMEANLDELMLIGSYLYLVIMGLSYAGEAKTRAVRAEAAATRMQLAALRAHLQPHFLFNALHTVVQLIPIDPARAMEAAELVADLLRATMEEDRDIISLGEEWHFVSRYLDLERIRFGERLRVRADVDPDLLDVPVPSFALQTLVENAVRHGAAPRIVPTDIIVTATGTPSEVTLSVRNNGNGAPTNGTAVSTGTGLNRLRERLVALHGNAARLTYGARSDGDFEAVVVVPRDAAND